jgi:hypothetical protein
MTEQSWTPRFRSPTSNVTKVLKSHAFLHSRERSATILEDAEELRALADGVERMDHSGPPLAAVADRVAAAVRFLRARAHRLETAGAPTHPDADLTDAQGSAVPSAGVATRERLLVASLHYLVTPVDLVPDFQAGGYIDDVILLAWVFGVAADELTPYLADDCESGEAPSEGGVQ